MALQQLTKNNFDRLVLRENRPVLVEFWAPWCSYCRRLAPVVETLNESYSGNPEVCQLNVDQEPELAARYSVEYLPSLLLFQNGSPKGTLVAPESKAQIDQFVKDRIGRTFS